MLVLVGNVGSVGVLVVIGREDLMIKIAKRIFNQLAYLILQIGCSWVGEHSIAH